MNKNIIHEEVMKIAKINASIIEDEIKKVCKKYNCNAEDLILVYYANLEIEISLIASKLNITNKFNYQNQEIKNRINLI